MQQKLKVMIMDDSEAIREGLKDILSGIPNIELIGEAVDGEDGIETLTKLQPDVIILDLYMPKLNGLDVLTFIKKNYPSIITIVLTNYPTEYFKLKCKKLGANYFYDKSNEFELIIKTLENIDHNRQIIQELN